ncbi:MAG: CHAD domain-containing protein [Bacteroidales bacterium]|nr:CHAD domain-containing protein [Bacteroidales bacterium]
MAVTRKKIRQAQAKWTPGNEPALRQGEFFGDGLQRILTEELQYALRQVERPREEMHLAVHELRKTLKRIRAIFRLIEPDIGYYICRKEIHRYRDIARNVASLRSLYVCLETIKKIRPALPGKIAGEPLGKTEKILRSQYESLLKKKTEEKEVNEIIRQELTLAYQQLEALPVLHNDVLIFEKAVRNCFRKGRKCWRKVARKPGSNNIHELRKHIKQLQFQLQVLYPLLPEKLGKPLASLQKLARLSGDEHDLYELSQLIRKYLKDEPYKKELLFGISRLILAHRKQLLPAARKFYNIKSKKFIADLGLRKITFSSEINLKSA